MNKIRYNFYEKGLKAKFSHEQLDFLWSLQQESLHTQISGSDLTLKEGIDTVYDDFLKATRRLFGTVLPKNDTFNRLDYVKNFYRKEVLDIIMAITKMSAEHGITIDHVTLPSKYKPNGDDFPLGTKILGVYVK